MKAKFLRSSAALLVFGVAISVGAGVSKAQYGGGGKDIPAQPAQPPADKGDKGPKINKAEEAAYKALYAARAGTPESQIPLCEDFIAKFPQSHYLMGVYSQLTSAYYAVGQEDKMFVAGTKAIELNPDNVDVLALLAMAMPRRVKATTPDAIRLTTDCKIRTAVSTRSTERAKLTGAKQGRFTGKIIRFATRSATWRR